MSGEEGHVGTAIIERSYIAELIVYEIHPLLFRIIVSGEAFGILKAEILPEAISSILRESAAAPVEDVAILHIGCHATVAHEQCHGISLRFGIVAMEIRVAHIGPIVVILLEVSRYRRAFRTDGA